MMGSALGCKQDSVRVMEAPMGIDKAALGPLLTFKEVKMTAVLETRLKSSRVLLLTWKEVGVPQGPLITQVALVVELSA